jgi:hypothetical protein
MLLLLPRVGRQRRHSCRLLSAVGPSAVSTPPHLTEGLLLRTMPLVLLLQFIFAAENRTIATEAATGGGGAAADGEEGGDAKEEQVDLSIASAQAGASKTIPVRAGEIRKGHFVVLKGKPCKVISISVSKTGKHGHAKANITGLDVFTGRKCVAKHRRSCYL